MKLNLGCGSDLRWGEEWLNADLEVPESVSESESWTAVGRDKWVSTRIDARVRKGTFVVQDATDPWRWGGGVFEKILMDNVLEHIPPCEHTHVFQEAWRCLEPGGLWELVVPQGRQLRSSWDHVVPESLLSRDRFRWLAKRPFHADAVKRGYPFELVYLGASRSWWRRVREWWLWFDAPNLRVVYRKPRSS